jgi:hypothetical protein
VNARLIAIAIILVHFARIEMIVTLKIRLTPLNLHSKLNNTGSTNDCKMRTLTESEKVMNEIMQE